MMTILLSDPRVAAVPVRDAGEALVRLDPDFGPARAWVRRGLSERLAAARDALPADLWLRVVEGHRPARRQRSIIATYSTQLHRLHPGLSGAELHHLTSRFVSPIEVAPHVAAAAVDLTLVDSQGVELDMGTPIDATPEQSGGACYFAAEGIDADARARRELLAKVLGGAGLVNYPTEWWHWSYGDRYWALMTGAPAALYGPVPPEPIGMPKVGPA
jgi:D-alanyl-D-alanine dipeptidase